MKWNDVSVWIGHLKHTKQIKQQKHYLNIMSQKKVGLKVTGHEYRHKNIFHAQLMEVAQ